MQLNSREISQATRSLTFSTRNLILETQDSILKTIEDRVSSLEAGGAVNLHVHVLLSGTVNILNTQF